MSDIVKFFIMDVDGTLTDGKIYIGESGEMFKAFNVKDGCAIKDILPQYGLTPMIVTARNSIITEYRCNELKINLLYQGVSDKLKIIEEVLGKYSSNGYNYSLYNCAYIGDDVSDLKVMKAIKEAGGVVGCPNDAIDKVKELADYVSQKSAGNGAIREFVKWIIESERVIGDNGDIY